MSKFTKIIYLLLFLTLFIHPHFFDGHIFFISRTYNQLLVIFFIIGIAYLIYILHERDIRHREKQKMVLGRKLKISSSKLNKAFEYIGLVNRRLPLLKNLTTDLLVRSGPHKKAKKTIFQDLLTTAIISIVNTDWGMFRFVNVNTQNTIKEFVCVSKNYALLKTQVANRELLKVRNQTTKFRRINDMYVLSSSDHKAAVQCFLIFPQGENNIENEYSILQIITDQAQLFYQYLFQKK